MGGATDFFKNLSAGLNTGMQMQFLMGKEGNYADLADARRANDMQALAGMDPMKAEQYLNLMGDDYIKKSGIPDSFVQRTRQSASALRDWTDSSQQMMAAALQSGNPAAIQRAHQAALSSYLAIPGAVRDAKSVENIMTEMGKNARDIYQADKIKRENQAAQELTGATKDLRGINNSELPRSLKNKAAANYFGRLNQRVNQNLPNNEKVTFNPRTVEMLGKLDQDQIDSVINFIEGNANQSPLETIHHAVKFLTAPDNEALDMLHKEILPRSTAQDDGKFLKPVDGPEVHPADGLSQDVENARDRMERLRTATSYDPSLKDKFLEAESQHLKLVKRQSFMRNLEPPGYPKLEKISPDNSLVGVHRRVDLLSRQLDLLNDKAARAYGLSSEHPEDAKRALDEIDAQRNQIRSQIKDVSGYEKLTDEQKRAMGAIDKTTDTSDPVSVARFLSDPEKANAMREKVAEQKRMDTLKEEKGKQRIQQQYHAPLEENSAHLQLTGKPFGDGDEASRAMARSMATEQAKAKAAAVNMGKPLEGPDKDAVEGLAGYVGLLNRLESFGKEKLSKYVGFLRLPAKQLEQYATDDKDFAEFNSIVKTIKESYFATAGKALTGVELSTLENSRPTGAEAGINTFFSKLVRSREYAKARIKNRLYIASTPREKLDAQTMIDNQSGASLESAYEAYKKANE